MNNGLFQNKTINIIVCAITAISFINSFISAISKIAAGSFAPTAFLGAFSSACILLFMLTPNKDYSAKKLLFPIAFSLIALSNLYTFAITLTQISLFFQDSLSVCMLLLNAVSAAATVLCFIGTLFDFRHIIFLKLGSLVYIISALLLLAVTFISVGGFEYFSSVPESVSAINLTAYAKYSIIVLFYFGIFLLTVSRKEKNS